jgi:monoamine oxidase
MNKSALVIGGGISGLATARELARHGITTTLIEAKDRFGGRIHTLHEGKIPIELGAEFVHGQSKALLAAIREAKLSTKDVPDTHQLFENGEIKDVKLWDIIGDVINQIDIRKPDCSFKEFLIRQKIPEPGRTMACNFVMGFDAAYPERASAHALQRAEYAAEQINMNTQSRVVEGYSALVEHFVRDVEAAGGRLLLNTSTRRIRWERGKVEVLAERNRRKETFAADIAVVTLPLAVLKTNKMKFEPSLPEKIEAIQGLEVGNVVRIVFHFKESFWEDFGFIHAFDEAIPTWWSNQRGPILTGWTGGPKADALLKLSRKKLEKTALEILGKIIFGGASVAALRKRLVAIHFYNWADDEEIRGAYSYIPVNGLDLPKVLAAPVADTLFFAGEATVFDAQTGTVFGALESGLRAAKEVLKNHNVKANAKEFA